MTKKKKLPTFMEFNKSIIQPDDSLSVEVKKQSVNAFIAWYGKYEEIWNNAPFWRKWRRRWMMIRNKHHLYNWRSSRSAPENSELILSSAFTNSFPSTHDMPEWGLSTRMADLMLLWGVSVRNSSMYRVVVKNHFVNHKMVQGIIEFDLYKLKM